MTSPRCREGTSLGAANRNGICFKSSNNQLGTLPCSPYPRTQWRMQLKTKSRGKQSCDQPTGVSFSLQTKQSLWEFWQEFDCSFTVWPRGTILCCQGLGCWQLHRFWQLQVASTSAWCLAGGRTHGDNLFEVQVVGDAFWGAVYGNILSSRWYVFWLMAVGLVVGPMTNFINKEARCPMT